MRVRALLIPLLLVVGCSSAEPTEATPAVATSAVSELTVVAWSDHLQRAVSARGTLTFLGDETTLSLDTSSSPESGQTLTGLEPGRYRVQFEWRETGEKPKRLDGEEVVYLEPGESRDVTVVVVDRKDDIGLLDSADTVPASSSLSRRIGRG